MTTTEIAPLIPLSEACRILGRSHKAVSNKSTYLGWKKYGVTTHLDGKEHKFLLSEILQMRKKLAIN